MSEPQWVSQAVVLAIHDEQLAEHGGSSGVRDHGLLASALARPQNLAAYGASSVPEMAAAYSFGILKNHPFVDGNKRTGLVVGELFLALNGYELVVSNEACVLTILAAADGSMDEAALMAWFVSNSVSS
ncbi:MAG: type II toxin-antitoxin system death-on-curing family toxin [Alphaproteobacteria bacterium]|nr:MAG: type II toxin-antitoxin system death-on-curing family toxin [Alphaproteobacteria bacterium]